MANKKIPKPKTGASRAKHEFNVNGLTTAQQVALRTLLDGRSQDDAAKAAGVSRSAVNWWVNHSPEFKAAFGEAQREVYAGYIHMLRVEAAKSVRCLAEIRDDRTLSAADRLRAATVLVQHMPITPDLLIPAQASEEDKDMLELLAMEGAAEAVADRESYAKEVLSAFDLGEQGAKFMKLATESEVLCLLRDGKSGEAGRVLGSFEELMVLQGRFKTPAQIDARLQQIEAEMTTIYAERERLEALTQTDPLELAALNRWRRKTFKLLGKEGFGELLQSGEPTGSTTRTLRQAKEIAERENIGGSQKPTPLAPSYKPPLESECVGRDSTG